MLCPKCKNQIPDNVLRCPHCNLKVRIICPECNSVSQMGKKFCSECGFQFFISCPSCLTINFYNADECRKCGYSLKQEPVAEIEEIPQDNFSKISENPRDISDEQISGETIEEIPEQLITEDIKSQTEEVDFISDNISKEQSSEELSDTSLIDEDGFYVSSENTDISDSQLKNIIEKVEEIDKTQCKKAEAEAIIQKKFEKQQEIEQESEEEILQEFVQLDQIQAQQAIIEAIQNPVKRVISLSGKEGLGKSLILKYVYDALRKDENYLCAMGECTALTQITPFGYLQDVLLNLCNLSNFSVDINEFIKNNSKALQAKFFNLNSQEINDLFNFLYPFKKADFNGILTRKDYTVEMLKKVVENLAIKSNVIFIIDDFENIDGASLNFIKNILSDEKFNEKVKILITNKYNKISQAYFYNKELKSNNYENIFLSGLDKPQSLKLITTLYGDYIDLPKNIENQIIENSKGTSAYVEQACQILGEIGAISVDEQQKLIFNNDFDGYIIPHNTYRILEERINSLVKNQPIIVQCLYYASILGNKFSIAQFQNVLQYLNIKQDDFNQICQFLISQNYISQLSENYFTFQNTLIWHYIYERAKTDENFVEYNKNIYNIVEPLTLSNNSLKPLLLQNCEEKNKAFEYWKNNSELASYLGDINLYVISLKQQLRIANDIPNILNVQDKIQIYEQMGKILYEISPKETINYITASIAYYKDEQNYNPVKIIELSGFLVQACRKTGNYTGIIEACDVAVFVLPADEYAIEKVLIVSKKLNALLNLGNYEEVINLSNTELLPMMEEALAKSSLSKIISDDEIFNIWVETSISLASAYALQGDKRVFETLSKVEEALVGNHIYDESKTRKILITKALANTVRGEIKSSSDILKEITSKYMEDNIDEDYILQLDFISIINKIVYRDYKKLVEEMFQVTTFADNINNLYIKNLLKLLLGYIIQTKSENNSKAMDIYNEEIVFFSKEKIATGALLCWFLIAKLSLITSGVDYALDIALKALDVAKSPKINNYIFMIALKQLIADMYIIKNDYEASKMYLEKAMMIAQKHDLKFMQMLLYESFAKYNAEMMSVFKDKAKDYALAAAEMYNSAVLLSQNLLLQNYEAGYKKELTAFNVSCRLREIDLNISVED